MSGHSKWSTIKHKKGLLDQRRGKVFSKLSKEITVAAKLGGGNPDMNPRLRRVLADARAASMPSDNIDRAVKKGTGELPGVNYEELTYEAYGPHGVALLVEVTTDNKNRSAPEVRSIFSKHGGHLAGSGSVAWMFHRRGFFSITKGKVTEDKLMDVVLDAGADDLSTLENHFEVQTPMDKFEAVSEALKRANIMPDEAKLTYIPTNTVAITDIGAAQSVLNLMSALDDHDDVQNVYANFQIPDEILAKCS